MSLVQTLYFITRKPALKMPCSGYLQGISHLRTALRSKIKDPLCAAEKKSLVTRPRVRTRPSKSGCKFPVPSCKHKNRYTLKGGEPTGR